jgi:hypothetical protein
MMSEHGKWGDLLIEGLKEAIAHARGERPDLRVDRYERGEDGTWQLVESRGGDSRAGWDDEFRRTASRGDDQLLDDTFSTTAWDDEEWEWPEDS